ncbi:hypothetical protein ACTPOK_02585 [Streptomyces inhibens]|uniref:hypothetical protein n=1 Tax=Streptomyces inhibens TaxID=2293571 RepID=UPI00402A6433
MEHLGHSWPWYALALVGVYRLTATGLDALVRRVVRTASQARAEHHHVTARTAPAAPMQRGPHTQTRPGHGMFPDGAIPPALRPPTASCCEEAR